MKIAVCLIVKEENRYLDEFIDHYLNIIKIDHIFIYDHNNIDGEHIKDYGNNVTVVNFRGYKKPCQYIAYKDCYEKYNTDYDYIMFIDADEFLYIPETGNDIHKFLELDKFKDIDCILINWQTIGDAGKIYYEDKPLKERFKNGEIYNISLNALAKPIVKKELKNIYWEQAHYPVSNEGMIYSYTDGIILDGEPFLPYSNFQEHNEHAYIKHYITKSTEEFFTWKVPRGTPDKEGNTYEGTEYEYYFMINEKTPEKVEYLKSQGIYEN